MHFSIYPDKCKCCLNILPKCYPVVQPTEFWFCFQLIFRIKDDWEARRIQVCRSGGAIQFQLWWQRPWDELSPLFPFPFLTVTECSEMKTLVAPWSSGSRTGSSLSLFNLTITFEQHQKMWEGNQCLGKLTKNLNAKQVGWGWGGLGLNNVVSWNPKIRGIPQQQLFHAYYRG